MNKQWKKFNQLTSECYENMICSRTDIKSWNKAFQTFITIVHDERNNNKDYAPEFYMVDEETDYKYDVSGWLQDYLDELDMMKLSDVLIQVCETMIGLFVWQEERPSEFLFLISSVLMEKGRTKEALEYCEKWAKEETENLLADTSLLYVRIALKDISGCEQIIKKHIGQDTKCTDENDIIFTAAEKFYQMTGNKPEEKKIEKAMLQYVKELEDYFMANVGDCDYGDDDLPF